MTLENTGKIIGLALLMGCSPNKEAHCEKEPPVEDESAPALCVARGMAQAWLENLPEEGVPLYKEGQPNYAGAYKEKDVIDVSLCELDPERSAARLAFEWMEADQNVPNTSGAYAHFYDGNVISTAMILFEGGHYSHHYEGDYEDQADIEEDCGYTEWEVPNYTLPSIPRNDWPKKFEISVEEMEADEELVACYNIYSGIKTVLDNKDYTSSLNSAAFSDIVHQYRSAHPKFNGTVASSFDEVYGDTLCLIGDKRKN